MSAADPRPVVNISVITPKVGKFDEFMALQLAQHRRLRGQVPGLVGGRLFRSRDNRTAVLVAVFETAEAAQRFGQDERFLEHMARVRPLLESAVPGTYDKVYEVGVV